MGEGGIKNGQKISDVFYGRPLRLDSGQKMYCKVASNRLSWLVAHLSIFRLFMKGKFDAYVPCYLWPKEFKIEYLVGFTVYGMKMFVIHF